LSLDIRRMTVSPVTLVKEQDIWRTDNNMSQVIDNSRIITGSKITNILDKPDTNYMPADAMRTLPQMFETRVSMTPNGAAYQQFDPDKNQWKKYTWEDTGKAVNAWRQTLATENLDPGDRVGIRRGNGFNWVLFDQAALSLGLVVVPLYVDDRADNVAYIVENSDIKLLYLQESEQWQSMSNNLSQLTKIIRVIIEEGEDTRTLSLEDNRVVALDDWLQTKKENPTLPDIDPADLATIVYTSGTTGKPKGVMLTHNNLTSNSRAGVNHIGCFETDRMISFLPLSHTFERTVGYYVQIMVGCEVVYARSILDLGEDLQNKKPTILISVPRIYERVYGKIKAQLEEGPDIKRKLFDKTVDVGWARFEHSQGRAKWQPKLLLWPILNKIVASKVRAKMGGRLRLALSGGAPLPPSISRIFIALDIMVLQGYGLTESSPIIAASSLEFNQPSSIGMPLQGVEVYIGENDELLARGPNIMKGYWKNSEATAEAIDADGWLHTEDKAKLEDGYLYIIGRLKEIIVLANGEKVPPADMEVAIAEDALFEQSLVIGEQKPCLTALVVLNPSIWEETKKQNNGDFDNLNSPAVEKFLLERISTQIHAFPGYAKIKRVKAMLDPWTVENELATPTMKLRRIRIEERFSSEINDMYQGKI